MSDGYSRPNAYKRVGVETASQGKLVVMLFDGAIQRTREAKRLIEKKNTQAVHNNLVRAQEIIAELRSALDMTQGELPRNLDRIYEYFQHLLAQTNVRKDPGPADTAIELMTEMRDTWQEAFTQAELEKPADGPKPAYNQHGSSILNMEG